MKTILVPTDFSAHADQALDYAVEIANAFSSEIILMHTFELYSTTGMFVSVESYLEDDAHKDLAKAIHRVRPKLKSGRGIRHKLYRGDAAPAIAQIAEKEKADLIIMGTQGASGLAEVFTGSTANGVIKSSRVPVLVIPEGGSFPLPSKIVFAIDHNDITSADVLSPLLRLAKRLEARVEVFHQDTGESDTKFTASLKRYLDPIEASYHFRLDEKAINDSINDFVEEVGADLLCMIRRKRSFIERIFHQSVTTNEIFQARIPMLVLHDK